MPAATTLLTVLELLAGCVWVGSIACLSLVNGAARRVLDPTSQIALFRAVGRHYAIVGTAALLLAIAAGLALAWPPPTWSNEIDAAISLAGVLLVITVVAMAQARSLGRIRRTLIGSHPDLETDRTLRRRASAAKALRALIAVVTLAVVILGAVALTQ